MPVVPNHHMLLAHCYHPFNVKLVLRQAFNSASFENNDFSSFGSSAIVGQAINKQMIAADDFQFYDLVARVIGLPGAQVEPGTALKSRSTVIRRKPDPVGLAADLHRLIDVKDENSEGLVDPLDTAIDFRFYIHI